MLHEAPCLRRSLLRDRLLFLVDALELTRLQKQLWESGMRDARKELRAAQARLLQSAESSEVGLTRKADHGDSGD